MTESSARSKKRQKRYLLLAGVLAVLLSALSGHWVLSLALLLFLYLLNELLWSDHIFYSPRADYRYRISGERLAHHWQGAGLGVAQGQEVGDTLLLELTVVASPAGYWFDPRVEVRAGDFCSLQYLERGVSAVRYLNLSGVAEALAAGQPVEIRGRYCSIDSSASILWSYDNGELAGKRVLVLAPHADDAEIAAFGLYSQADGSCLVTVTAGETEVEQFAGWCGDEQQASRFKGEVRCLDSAAAALWAGLAQEQCINLGYGCLQLQAMAEQPDRALRSPWSGLSDTRPYRRFNRVQLPSDADGATRWDNLVADLAAIVRQQRPDLVVCPHPLLDTHRDHRYASLALWQACQHAEVEPQRWLLYANHLDASQDFPFGPAHSETGLPPIVQGEVPIPGLYRVGLDEDLRRRKALALDLMHDLKRPQKWKKWWRKRLHQQLLGRPLNPYGEDDFFRKAVRPSEWFVVADGEQMAQLLESLD